MILRDFLANDRTLLANERTLLAYIRTALVMLGLGITMVKLLADAPTMVMIGWALFPSALMVFFFGIYRYIVVNKRLPKIEKKLD